MPGHHPHGAWISARAKHIAKETEKEYGPDKGESVAYALATQQAHSMNKSPKGFRTPEGVFEARSKYRNPEEYKKTASIYLQSYVDEFCKIAYISQTKKDKLPMYEFESPEAFWGRKREYINEA